MSFQKHTPGNVVLSSQVLGDLEPTSRVDDHILRIDLLCADGSLSDADRLGAGLAIANAHHAVDMERDGGVMGDDDDGEKELDQVRIGVISDPHGCLVGLRATLDWLAREGVDLIVSAGDIVNFGTQPNECVSLLIEQNVASVQGNSDRDILMSPPDEAITDKRVAQIVEINNWCREQLTSASRKWLANLPSHLTPAADVLVVHGGLEEPDEVVDVDAIPDFPPRVSVVVAGHLHKPFVARVHAGVWINAGSAGRSCDGDPRAAVALLEDDAEGWQASIHRVPFDLEAVAQAIRQAKMPYAERLIETQRKACWW